MSNPTLTKNLVAEAAIPAHRIVKHGSALDGVLLAVLATEALAGVTTELPADEGERCDVHLAGLVEVEFGGTVSRGDPITTDATGRAVKADPAAGESANVVGVSRDDAVVGDIGVVLLAPSVLKTPGDPILTKNFVAEGAIPARRLVKYGSAPDGVLLATLATDALVGVTTELAAEETDTCVVHLAGLVEVEFGASVSRGDPVTADATGRAVKADPGAGESANVVGVSLVTAEVGAVGEVLLSRSVLKTPAG